MVFAVRPSLVIALAAIVVSLALAYTIDEASCGKPRFIDPIDAAVAEAMKVAVKASDRLSNYYAPNNDAVRNIYTSLFGLNSVEYVLNVFNTLLELPQDSPWMTIFCNEDHLTFTPAGNNTPAKWYDKVNNLYEPLIASNQVEQADPNIRPCSSSASKMAYTYNNKYIVLCPPTLEIAKTTISYNPNASRAIPSTGITLANMLAKDKSGNIFSHQPLTSLYHTVSCVLLHEFTHSMILGRNMTDDLSVTDGNLSVKAYQYKEAHQLALENNTRALHNADNYALLGAGLFFDKYFWNEGLAIPIIPAPGITPIEASKNITQNATNVPAIS
ncbi:MAG: hypothetical protein M1825_003745 [Sarcosagium campestre]|nr:MAG: hypothetical protein M1825_003745 [Sarcosagium campestre]